MFLRSWTNIALLVGVAILLTIYVLWPGGDRLPPAPLTEHEPRAVSEFRVTWANGHPPVRIMLENERGWTIVEPVDHPARDTRVVRVLSLLNDRTDSCYRADSLDLAEYGLDEPPVILHIGETRVEFGNQAADGRRHVRAGERMCLIDDFSYPILAGGLAEIAQLALLPAGSEPVRIETPEAMAQDEDRDGGWEFLEGEGAALRWAARWRSARANSFELDPGDENLGTVRVEVTTGEQFEWQLVQRADEDQDLILVPRGHDFGLRIEPAKADGLITPPPVVEDGLE